MRADLLSTSQSVTGADAAPGPSPDFDTLVSTRRLRVAVVGLGYTGLPLACALADAGFQVLGIDTDSERVEAVAEGRSYLIDVPSERLSSLRPRLTPTSDATAAGSADAIVLCLPTPLADHGGADLSHVNHAVDALSVTLRRGALVILQSTVPPGTTLGISRELAVRCRRIPGEDLFVACSPERADPANKGGWGIANTPRLTGGVTAECTRRAALVIRQVCQQVLPVSSPAVAEMAKLLENSFRLVNIALAVEITLRCYEHDVPAREVFEAAATKPYAFLPHNPGAGVGGECIPVDPMFLRDSSDPSSRTTSLVEAASKTVMDRPRRVADCALAALADRVPESARPKVLIAGVAYKANVPDTRNTPAAVIVRRLRDGGCEVSYTDPLVPTLVVDGTPVPRVHWGEQTLREHDAVVVVTPHDFFNERPIWPAARLLIDAWAAVPPSPHVIDV
jgi:UDP-N-acetyl-D-glucosamine dehydrogenase